MNAYHPVENMQRPDQVVRRETVVAMLQAAMESGEIRFARQLALSWLAAYPGDLEVALIQAQVLLRDGRPGQVLPALDLICRRDPFCKDGYRLMASACQGVDPVRQSFALTSLYSLGGGMPEGGILEPWGTPLRMAIEALEGLKYPDAEKRVQEAFHLAPDLLLAAAVHLLVDRATQEALSVNHLAQLYHTRWPDCLLFRLILAETQLEVGNEPEAVRLLHICVARDATGITATRLWGKDHPYRSLWPEEMVIHFETPIPAGVATRMGWNRLAPGEIRPSTGVPVDEVQTSSQPQGSGELTEENVSSAANASESPLHAEEAAPSGHEDSVDPTALNSEGSTGAWNQPADAGQADNVSIPQGSNSDGETAVVASPAVNPESAGIPADDVSSTFEKEIARLAKKIKQPALERADGRFPVYVIFSSKDGLNRQFGPKTSEVLDGELRRLTGLIRKRKGWGAMVYYPDDTACASQIGLLPMAVDDPWKLKHALSELDTALGKRGERIGALLIIGGDPVVPFHRLPNPTDDVDGEVPSDSPYATLDSNYFIPEWPVGRLPGESGPDAGLLLEQIRQTQRYHGQRTKAATFFMFDLPALFQRLLERFTPAKPVQSFGYTAAVWRRSSLAVFRPIGAPHTVLASPPESSGSVDRERIMAAKLGYYNLHGLEDSPAWYGQRDPMETAGADYPVALSPDDLRRNGHSPRIIFSEACYGGNILGKGEKDSLALKFLSMGTLGVVASTCTAYGSVNTPLVAADLLGNRFWQHLKSGRCAGEALLQAKIDLVREMERRQGFLDGEDQKTLISFVLYGDPLAAYEGFRSVTKASPRLKDHPAVKTVCDLAEEGAAPVSVSQDVLKQVKGLLSEYLPGAEMAELHIARQHAGCAGKDHDCPTSELSRKKKRVEKGNSSGEGRLVITASKQVKVAQHIHRHYLRMTLDEAGTPLKVSISR